MNELLTGGSLVLVILSLAIFAIASILMPVFVIVLAFRLKRANEHLRQIEHYLALAAQEKTRPIVRPYSGRPGKIMAEP